MAVFMAGLQTLLPPLCISSLCRLLGKQHTLWHMLEALDQLAEAGLTGSILRRLLRKLTCHSARRRRRQDGRHPAPSTQGSP